MKKIVMLFLVILFLTHARSALATDPIYPDFSRSSCEVVWDPAGYSILVRGIEWSGYGLWIRNYWNPNTLSFDFLPKAQLGIEHEFNPGGGTRACTLLYNDPSGRRANIHITVLDSGTLKLDAELLDGSIRLCLDNSHVFVTSNGVNFIHRDSQAGGSWGGCGDLIPGNTYQGLILKNFYNNDNPGAKPDFTKPFNFNYMDDSWRSFSVTCS